MAIQISNTEANKIMDSGGLSFNKLHIVKFYYDQAAENEAKRKLIIEFYPYGTIEQGYKIFDKDTLHRVEILDLDGEMSVDATQGDFTLYNALIEVQKAVAKIISDQKQMYSSAAYNGTAV